MEDKHQKMTLVFYPGDCAEPSVLLALSRVLKDAYVRGNGSHPHLGLRLWIHRRDHTFISCFSGLLFDAKYF